jgi:hypothetical protein
MKSPIGASRASRKLRGRSDRCLCAGRIRDNVEFKFFRLNDCAVDALNRATRRTLEPSHFLNPDCPKADGRGLDAPRRDGVRALAKNVIRDIVENRGWLEFCSSSRIDPKGAYWLH